jgi:hypothetical protein
MPFNKLLPVLFITLLTASIPAAAQLTPAEPDPLARIRDAASANVQACSVTGETLCEQVAPKIIANAQGDSPLAENLRHLRAALATKSKSVAAEQAIAWALSAFRQAGLEPRVEKYANPDGSPGEQQNVVAEYRGREEPDEWVLVGAHLGPKQEDPNAFDNRCDAASLIEAARDISLPAMHPKRSIRFVLFTGEELGTLSAWAYTRAHRAELNRARAAILFHSQCRRITGYANNGRRDIEAGLHDAMKPIESLVANLDIYGPLAGIDDFDFLLEGIPTLSALGIQEIPTGFVAHERSATTDELDTLRHNVAVVAVTAFGVAERAAPIGQRLSHSEIEVLLGKWDVYAQTEAPEAWKQWKSGQRGRLP